MSFANTVVDIQEVAFDILHIKGLKGVLPSMADVMERVLGCLISKSKDIQLSDCNWESRPLNRGQLEYPAVDAAITLQAYERMYKLGVEMPSKT